MKRCAWCTSDPLYQSYHDKEWGVPLLDNQKLFEMLNLEGMQAGLSWLTILKKREYFRQAFAHFDAEKIAKFNDQKIAQLLQNPGIIRNRLKIAAIITNARAYLAIQEKNNFKDFLWQFTDHRSVQPHRKSSAEIPTSNSVSDQMAKALKQQGFKFVGTTICYAFMQAVGIINDHTIDCFRYAELKELKE